MDITFVAVEHLAVKVIPEIAARAMLATKRIQGVVQGATGDQGWELLQSLENDAYLVGKAVGGFSDLKGPPNGWSAATWQAKQIFR